MAQNFFETYQEQVERRKKQQGPSITEPIPALDVAASRAAQKKTLRGQPQFQQQSPALGAALEGYQTAFDPIMAPLSGTSKLMTSPSGEFGGLGQWGREIGQGARVATGGIDSVVAPGTLDYILTGKTSESAPPTAAPTTPPAPVTSTGGGAKLASQPSGQPGSHVPVQSEPIPNLPTGAVGWQGTPGWGPKETFQQARAFYERAKGSEPQSSTARTGDEFVPPGPVAPADARSMGLGPIQQEAFNEIARGDTARATDAAYNRWLQMQGLGQAERTQKMTLATGESALQDAALRRQMVGQEMAGTTPGQNIDRAKAAEEMLRYMPTMTQDATGKMVPNPERAQLEQQVRTWLGVAPTVPTAAPATTPTAPSADQPTSFLDKAHAFARQAATAGGAAATPGMLAKMGVKSAGRGVLGPLAYGGLTYSGLNMLADVLDPEGAKAVARNPKVGLAGTVVGGVGGYKMGPRPGVATPTEAGPGATPPLAEGGAGAGTSSTMSGTKAPPAGPLKMVGESAIPGAGSGMQMAPQRTLGGEPSFEQQGAQMTPEIGTPISRVGIPGKPNIGPQNAPAMEATAVTPSRDPRFLNVKPRTTPFASVNVTAKDLLSMNQNEIGAWKQSVGWSPQISQKLASELTPEDAVALQNELETLSSQAEMAGFVGQEQRALDISLKRNILREIVEDYHKMLGGGAR